MAVSMIRQHSRLIRLQNTFNLTSKLHTGISRGIERKFSKKSFAAIREIVRTVQSIYPDRWDIQFELYPCQDYPELNHITGFNTRYYYPPKIYQVFIIIHFPELTIRNMDDKSHILKDFFIKLPIAVSKGRSNKDYKIKLELFSGTRTTFTHLELLTNYIHSHMSANPTVDIIEYHSFCFGSGSLESLFMEYNNSPSSDLLEYILYSIQTYLEYESLETTPHRRMANIVLKDEAIPSVHFNAISTVEDQVLRELKRKEFNFTWEFRNGRYVIADEEEVNDYCLELYEQGNLDSIYICYKSVDGKFYTQSHNKKANIIQSYRNKMKNEDSLPCIIFRGEKVRLNIVEELDMEKIPEDKRVVLPAIVKQIKNIIENAVNLQAIRRSNLRRQSNSNTGQADCQENTVPMQQVS